MPGDGEFKIHNNKKALEQFHKQVSKEWPDKPLKDFPKLKKSNIDYPETAFKEYEIADKKRLEEYLEETKRIHPKDITSEELKHRPKKVVNEYYDYFNVIDDAIKDIALKNTRKRYPMIKRMKYEMDFPRAVREFYEDELQRLRGSFKTHKNAKEAMEREGPLEFKKQKIYIEKKLRESKIESELFPET